jgi:hypothetical protein
MIMMLKMIKEKVMMAMRMLIIRFIAMMIKMMMM